MRLEQRFYEHIAQWLMQEPAKLFISVQIRVCSLVHHTKSTMHQDKKVVWAIKEDLYGASNLEGLSTSDLDIVEVVLCLYETKELAEAELKVIQKSYSEHLMEALLREGESIEGLDQDRLDGNYYIEKMYVENMPVQEARREQ